MPRLEVWFGSASWLNASAAQSDNKDNALTVRSFSVHEQVSGLFEVALLCMSHNADIDLETIAGQPAGFRVTSAILHTQGGLRHWKGICRHIEQVRVETSEKGLCTYQLTIVPRLWLLTQRRGSRIFQHQSIPDIVDALLGEWQVEPEWQIDRGAYPKLEYRVQYGETDYTFFARLLEEAGIAFTFPDGGDRGSVLTLSDRLPSGEHHRASPLPFIDEVNQSAERDFVTRVQMSHGVRPGALTLRDYGFRHPEHPCEVKAPSAKAPEDFYEQYHYRPGVLVVEGGAGGDTPVGDDQGVARPDEARGRDRAGRELAAERGGKREVSFETNVIELLPGTLFTMAKHPHSALAPEHPLLVMELSLTGSEGGPWTTRGRAYFAEEPFFPALVTPRPKALGHESATVVGPPGEGIHVDELGRVRVQFPWDRKGTNDDRSSCWIRVSQGWAGLGYGMMTLPRVGQEVLVGFLGGDPDQPIIVGRVYNGREQLPYTLPKKKTVSGWKSASSPGGHGYNELLFDDNANNELIKVRAQRDLWIDVKHDQRRRVEGKDSLTVNGSRHEEIKESLLVKAKEVVIEAEKLTLKTPGGFISIHSGGVDIVGTLVNINSGGEASSKTPCSPDPPGDAVEAPRS